MKTLRKFIFDMLFRKNPTASGSQELSQFEQEAVPLQGQKSIASLCKKPHSDADGFELEIELPKAKKFNDIDREREREKWKQHLQNKHRQRVLEKQKGSELEF